MSITIQAFINDVLNKINADADTSLFSLLDGDNSTDETLTVNQTIIQEINDACDDWCYSCFPIVSAVTYSVPIGTQTIPYGLMTGGGSMWGPQVAKWNMLLLRSTSRERLEISYPSYTMDANGIPSYWWDAGRAGIGIYPRPSAIQTLTVSGLITPTHILPNADLDGVLTDIPDAYMPALVARVAARLAAKRVDDGSMSERISIWSAFYENAKSMELVRLWNINPELARQFYPAHGKQK